MTTTSTRQQRLFYNTWKEAGSAAQKLGIKSSIEYQKRYREDPQLPSAPDVVYPDFPMWNVFLNTGRKAYVKNPYTTWKEAGVAGNRLGIKGYSEYQKRCREDPRLPSTPWQFYPDFPGWSVFLNTGRKTRIQNPYTTWKEASVAAQGLGIKISTEYPERYREDPRLPSNPWSFYSDFPGFKTFLNTGFYTICAEASAAAQKLGIKSQREYHKRYREDPRLHSAPQTFYPDFPGFKKFLEKE